MPSIRLRDDPLDFDLAFLDCDGVIFDINAAKTQAFVDALASYPPTAVGSLADYHRAHGGISRYVKFRHFFTELCPVDDVEASVQAALDRTAVRQRIPTTEEVVKLGQALGIQGIIGSPGARLFSHL